MVTNTARSERSAGAYIRALWLDINTGINHPYRQLPQKPGARLQPLYIQVHLLPHQQLLLVVLDYIVTGSLNARS